MERHARLDQLERWVEAIRDGYYARLLWERVKRDPARFEKGRWSYLAPPLVDWQPSELRKAAGGLMPVRVRCQFLPDLYPAGFITRRWCDAGERRWSHAFDAGDGLAVTDLRAMLRQMVKAGEDAMGAALAWSEQFRLLAAKRTSARISYGFGVEDGFVFTMTQVTSVAEDLAEVVRDRLLCFAGIDRVDARGQRLASAGDADLERVLRGYLSSRAFRFFAKQLGITERELRSRMSDPSATLSQVRAAAPSDVIDRLPASPIVPADEPSARRAPESVVEAAREAHRVVSEAGGPRVFARDALAGLFDADVVDGCMAAWHRRDRSRVLWALASSLEDDAGDDWAHGWAWHAATGEWAPPFGAEPPAGVPADRQLALLIAV